MKTRVCLRYFVNECRLVGYLRCNSCLGLKSLLGRLNQQPSKRIKGYVFFILQLDQHPSRSMFFFYFTISQHPPQNIIFFSKNLISFLDVILFYFAFGFGKCTRFVHFAQLEKNYKYFIDDFDDYKTKPLHIMYPKTGTYVKFCDGETKWMYFLI